MIDVNQRPPMPADADSWEVQRQAETALRRRMLSGQWHGDAQDRMRNALGIERSTAIQDVDISSNVFAQLCTTLSVLYDVMPQVEHDDPEAAKRMTALLDDASFAAVMQEVQRFVLGLREMLVHVSVLETSDGDQPVSVVLRPVYPDLVTASPDPRSPASPIAVTEACLSRDPATGKEGWVWQVTDATPGRPAYRLVDPESGSDRHGDVYTGEDYPWFDGQGRPVLPYIAYHAQVTHNLWDAWAWSEIVRGTLETAVDRSSYRHSLRTAAFAQRYMINANIAANLDANGRGTLVADPSTILLFSSDENGSQPQAGQWSASFDPANFQSAVAADEGRLASNSGVPASDLLRTSGDPRSGYAMILGREGKKEASRRFEPAFRRSDLQLLRTIAKMCNGLMGDGWLPESGWRISYREPPLTESEKHTRDDRIISQLQAGLLSPAEARSRLLGESLEDAKAAINAIRREAALRILEETE